jgi:hypothetical protein
MTEMVMQPYWQRKRGVSTCIPKLTQEQALLAILGAWRSPVDQARLQQDRA